MSIYVGNLSFDVTKEDLNDVFVEYGTVKKVALPTDRETGKPRGFAFVEMSTEAEEEAAIEALEPIRKIIGSMQMPVTRQVNKLSVS